MAVEGQDGQQYVVLEVIQLPENEMKSPKKEMVVGSNPVQVASAGSNPKKSEKKQADLASAFGFDDDDEDDV